MKILQLHLWIQNKKQSWTEPEVVRITKAHPEGIPAKGRRIVIEPESQSLPAMKSQLAAELEKHKKQLLYYYVVVVVEKSDGTPGYRTIVPKTLVA